jgi:hypothetical protein
MVPGMAERARLAADVRRLEWLADAYVGPTRIAPSPHGVAPMGRQRFERALGVWRRGLAAAFVLGRRIRNIESSSTLPPPEPAPAPIRHPSLVQAAADGPMSAGGAVRGN